MTNEEAIEILQEEHNYVQEPCYVMNAIKKAIEALQAAEKCDQNATEMRPDRNTPLTLEQLQDMYDKPAKFVDLYTDFDENVIVGVFGKTGVFYSTSEEANQFKSTKDYGARWIAYAYPPAHIDLEAWTADWRELHGDKMVGLDDCGDDVYRHYHYSVCTSCGKGSAVKTHFCPVCGKAMTKEARAMLEKRLMGCVK